MLPANPSQVHHTVYRIANEKKGWWFRHGLSKLVNDTLEEPFGKLSICTLSLNKCLQNISIISYQGMLVKSYSPSKLAEKSLELKLRSSSVNLKKL